MAQYGKSHEPVEATETKFAQTLEEGHGTVAYFFASGVILLDLQACRTTQFHRFCPCCTRTCCGSGIASCLDLWAMRLYLTQKS